MTTIENLDKKRSMNNMNQHSNTTNVAIYQTNKYDFSEKIYLFLFFSLIWVAIIIGYKF
jgi:hypothetical protein